MAPALLFLRATAGTVLANGTQRDSIAETIMKRIAIILMLALGGAACSDGAGPANQAQVSLSFSTSRTAAAPAPGFFASVMADTLTDGQNELIITKAEVVLREIELKKIEAVSCDSTVSHDACEKFQTGPMLLDLPLNGQVENTVTIVPDPATYDELEFDLHKVSNDDPEDAAFRAAHPHMIGNSIRVEGTYNGRLFVFETNLNEEQRFDLIPPITVGDMSTTTNVTVLIDLSRWFVDGSGSLVDPQSGNKGGVNENLIKENVKNSVEAFEDHDSDGDESHRS